jgi:5-methylcytosine-specific restriction endonuclease McrA
VPRWADDRYVDAITAATSAICAGDIAGGRVALEPIAGQIWSRHIPTRHAAGASAAIVKRPNASARRAARIFARDRYHCRYCAARVVPKTLAMLLHELYPLELPFHRNYRGGYTHPIFWVAVPEVDHLASGFSGGNWQDEENLVTACVACNQAKGAASVAEAGFELKPTPTTDWVGLTDRLRRVWEAAESPAFARSWITAVEREQLSG